MNAGVVECLAIGLAFVTVVVILRYRRRPRGERYGTGLGVQAASRVVPIESVWPHVTTTAKGDRPTINWEPDHVGSGLVPRHHVSSQN